MTDTLLVNAFDASAFVRPAVDFSCLDWGAYLRISKDEEGTRYGIETQRETLLALATARGIPHERIRWYVDNAISASAFARAARPEWRQLKADVESGKIRGILCLSIDRFTRKMTENAWAVEWIRSTGVYWLDTEGGDPTTANGAMVLHIKGAVAQQESARISERTRARFAADRARGQYSSNVRLFGYAGLTESGTRTDGMTWHPVEGPLVQLAFRWTLEGRSTTSIDREWRRVLPDEVIGHRAVVNALRNPAYCGLLRHRGVIVGRATNIRPLVSEADWYAVQQLRAEYKEREAFRYHGGRRAHLWSGFLRCECGSVMASQGVAYKCSGRKGGCGSTSVRHKLLSLVMDDWMRQALALDAPEAAAAQAAPVLDDATRAERARLDGLLTRTRRRIEDGTIDEEDGWAMIGSVRDKLAEIDRQEARATRARAEAATRAARASRNLHELWTNADPELLDLKRALAAEYVDRIVVVRATTPGGGRVEPERIRVIPTR